MRCVWRVEPDALSLTRFIWSLTCCVWILASHTLRRPHWVSPVAYDAFRLTHCVWRVASDVFRLTHCVSLISSDSYRLTPFYWCRFRVPIYYVLITALKMQFPHGWCMFCEAIFHIPLIWFFFSNSAFRVAILRVALFGLRFVESTLQIFLWWFRFAVSCL